MPFDDTINTYFVSTNSKDKTASSEINFANALKLLQNHIPPDNIREIKSSEGLPLIASGRLSKKDIFVFDHFEGDFFEQLQKTKSLIVGPKCLITCLIKREPIPLGTSPVYTSAMKNLNISATGIPLAKKESLRTLIQWMGGHYFQNFGRGVTHLISNTIKSTKYEHATLNNIPVMHIDWVQRVWERSCVDDIIAVDQEFDKYRLPIFFGTNITCTGLSVDKKNNIMRLVNDNGGTYQSAFRSQQIDIVITEKDKTNSEKYKAAVAYKKDVLLPEWIYDSVEKGFALPTKGYHVKPLKVSTPTKTDQSIADFSQMSDISRISMPGRNHQLMSTLNETVATTLNDTQHNTFKAPEMPGKNLQRAAVTHKQQQSNVHINYREILEQICPKDAKKAGNFLEDCNVYLSGFNAKEKEKLYRVLNGGAAIRYDVLNEKVTHIIVGHLNDNEFRQWKRNNVLDKKCHVVGLNWLLDSIKLKKKANETVYRLIIPESIEPVTASPSTKKHLKSSLNSSLQHSKKDSTTKKKLFEPELDEQQKDDEEFTEQMLKPIASSTEMPIEEDEQDLISQYRQQNLPEIEMPQSVAAKDITIKNGRNIQNMDEDNTLVMPIASSTILPQKQQLPQPFASEITSTASSITIDYDNLNFLHGVSIYIHNQYFEDQLYTQLVNECEAAQGNVVQSTYRDSVDYAIVSFEFPLDPDELPVKAYHIVTELYLEQCLKSNKLVPIQYYHKHVPKAANAKPLNNITIVISTYTGLERDYIESLAQMLGAKVNNNFVKKERPLLICPIAEGSKYDAAIKWRYPVVNSRWLVQCATHGIDLEYQGHLVGNCTDEFPQIPALRERNGRGNTPIMETPAPKRVAIQMDTDFENNVNEVNELNNSKRRRLTSQTSSSSNFQEIPFINRDAITTPANVDNDFTPLRNKRVSELAGPNRNTRITPSTGSSSSSSATTPTSTQSPIGGNQLDSPHTPANTYMNRLNEEDFINEILKGIEDDSQRKYLMEIISEIRNNPTPELERIRRLAWTPIEKRAPTPKGIPEFCTTPAFQKRMVDAFENRMGVPLKKLRQETPIDIWRRRILKNTCDRLGIPYTEDDDNEIPGTFKQNPKNVANSRIDDIPTDYTNTSPRTETPLIRRKNVSPRNSSILAGRSIFDQMNRSITTNVSDGFIPGTQTTPTASQEQHNSMNLTTSGLIKRVSLGKSTINFDKINFDDTTLNNRDSDSIKKSNSLNVDSPEVKQITDYLRDCASRRQSLKRSELEDNNWKMEEGNEMETEAAYVQPFESEQFGAFTEDVGWKDPAEFSLERRPKPKRTMQYKGKPKFSISCNDEQMRDNIIQKILTLGGEVSDNLVNFDPECTHFVCERPNRGEKIIGCISSGKWVLGLNYIEECYSKDVFIDEELYEWGNGKAMNLPAIKPDEQIIAHAAHNWRKKLSPESPNCSLRGSFSGFRALLRIPERTYEAMKTIIKAGKGDVIDVRTPYSEANGAHLATHCFVEVKRTPLLKSDYDFLRRHNVRILTHMYINAYLMNGNEEDCEKFEIKM